VSTVTAARPVAGTVRPRPLRSIVRYCRRNPSLGVGLVLIALLLLVGIVGPVFVDTSNAEPASVIPDEEPSIDYPMGTDDQGRDLLAVLVAGIPLTLRVGFIAGTVGLVVGASLGLIAGYRGGMVDAVVRTVVDTLLTVPGLLVLIIIADSIKEVISINLMALIVASLAWMYPARAIRAQVLTLRERSYIQMASLSGADDLEIVTREILPNLLPYLAASFVAAVSAAVLASIGLEALGLGPQNDPTIGMTIYWAISFNALVRGLWWWWGAPIVVIVLLFVGLFLVSAGLDELANPRRRRAA
jgi:peptide/nickel transport system permease protein